MFVSSESELRTCYRWIILESCFLGGALFQLNKATGMVLTSGPLDLLSEDTSVEVLKDMGDFVDDEDLTPFKITFYRGVCDEEISEEDMVSSTTRSAILEKMRATLMRI
ncbi:hypothetical protein AAZX31_19G085300 [Glycine max]